MEVLVIGIGSDLLLRAAVERIANDDRAEAGAGLWATGHSVQSGTLSSHWILTQPSFSFGKNSN